MGKVFTVCRSLASRSCAASVFADNAIVDAVARLVGIAFPPGFTRLSACTHQTDFCGWNRCNDLPRTRPTIFGRSRVHVAAREKVKINASKAIMSPLMYSGSFVLRTCITILFFLGHKTVALVCELVCRDAHVPQSHWFPLNASLHACRIRNPRSNCCFYGRSSKITTCIM